MRSENNMSRELDFSLSLCNFFYQMGIRQKKRFAIPIPARMVDYVRSSLVVTTATVQFSSQELIANVSVVLIHEIRLHVLSASIYTLSFAFR